MSLISRPHLKFELAKALHDYIKTNANNTYFYFGKATVWEGDSVPDITDNSIVDVIKNAIVLNRVSELDVYMCYDRIDWEKSVSYPAYDPVEPYINTHVLTKDMRVYKCLDNLNSGKSLIEPTHTTFGSVRYEDGYTWKYLYTLSNREIHNYLTDDYIPINIRPVTNSIQNQTEFNAIRGTIDSIKVLTGGSNYTRATIKITGDGTGCTAVPIIQSGIIKAIRVTNPGTGYTYANVEITGTGNGATAEPKLSPIYGHGSNLLKELNANNVMVISQHMLGNEDNSNVPEEFTYTQLGLVSGISGNITGRVTVPMTYKLRVSGADVFNDSTKAMLNNMECTIVFKEILDGTHYLYVNGLPDILNAEELLNKIIRVGESSATVLEVVSEPLKVVNDFNTLHLENVEAKRITNKNLDILRLVIKGLPAEIEK